MKIHKDAIIHKGIDREAAAQILQDREKKLLFRESANHPGKVVLTVNSDCIPESTKRKYQLTKKDPTNIVLASTDNLTDVALKKLTSLGVTDVDIFKDTLFIDRFKGQVGLDYAVPRDLLASTDGGDIGSGKETDPAYKSFMPQKPRPRNYANAIDGVISSENHREAVERAKSSKFQGPPGLT